jgi:hypothetical protein
VFVAAVRFEIGVQGRLSAGRTNECRACQNESTEAALPAILSSRGGGRSRRRERQVAAVLEISRGFNSSTSLV